MAGELDKTPLLDDLNRITLGLIEIDQECAVLDTIYKEASQKRIISRIDETLGELLRMKEKVKSLPIEHYKDSKFSNLTNKQSK